ncbi:hypothetical protein CEXT_162741 [Caerostris extrusa]|uniref:Ribosomal protein L32 n=1 Tax=Caerostris extrusa TaxID=172846 RepID=A0AAV4QPZ1_CAEEX|nr:hypothetical protein CEXT_162741 [Caerostris extrusa]
MALKFKKSASPSQKERGVQFFPREGKVNPHLARRVLSVAPNKNSKKKKRMWRSQRRINSLQKMAPKGVSRVPLGNIFWDRNASKFCFSLSISKLQFGEQSDLHNCLCF